MADTNEIEYVDWEIQSKTACAAGGDANPPVLAVVSPTPGGAIRPQEAFVLDITDDQAIGLSVITVQLGAAHEVVWLRTAFADAYAERSTRAPITDGYRYTVLRAGGWTSSPTFHVEAIDLGGNLGA